jgi:hypothetical protein
VLGFRERCVSASVAVACARAGIEVMTTDQRGVAGGWDPASVRA